ncbi:MAG TPA: hypothetical protein VIN67_01605 [Desulfobaccales bacterium]
MEPKKLILRLGWMLLLSLLCLSFWGAAAQGGEVAGLVKPAQYREVQASSVLEISIQSDDGARHPPGELLLSDPEGRMSGSDAEGIKYREIPESTYLREGDTYLLHIGDAESGRYSLRVIGLDHGKFTLHMTGYDQNGAHAMISFTRLTEPGVMHIFLIDYSNLAGAKIKARQIHRVE